MQTILAPLQATLVQWLVDAGDAFTQGQTLAILEAMKMEHEVRAQADGQIQTCFFTAGDLVQPGDVLATTLPAAVPQGHAAPQAPTLDASVEAIRSDLAAVLARHVPTLDAARPDARAKRHALGFQTARENIGLLCDAGSFREFGALTVAAQSLRRSQDDLIANTPADGMVTGVGRVGGQPVAVLAYDATVLAGTQGMRNHQKTDRLLGVAKAQRLPVILFAEGGGGRPGDTDMPIVAGLHVTTFASMAALRGHVPVIGIAQGRCFAGNAALLACADVIIATTDANIGMGGPAMIEGGGLGSFKPEDIGPAVVQHANGVIDVLVADEPEAIRIAKLLLGLLRATSASHLGTGDESSQEPACTHPQEFAVPDPMGTQLAAKLRGAVPQNRLRVYDTVPIMQALADPDTMIALKTGYGQGIHTAVARIGGRAVGVMANNPMHLGGAVDANAADKAAGFMQWCTRFGLPMVSLIDTPGFMVGPQSEADAQVRWAGQMFVAAAAYLEHAGQPFMSVVLRKGYGLGAMAMSAGGFHATHFTIAWPTAEFGAMGLEGAVRLGYRKELAACETEPERQALFDKLLAEHVDKGSAIRMAETLEIDAVIDPALTRSWILSALQS